MAKRGESVAVWDVHPGVDMVRNWCDSLPAETGRSLGEWETLLHREGPPSEKERRQWLRKKHGLSSRAAMVIAQKSVGENLTWDGDPKAYLVAAQGYVDALFGAAAPGSKRSLFDALVARARAFGADVRVCPCQTMVPFYRRFVFAEVRPTAGGVELALALEPGTGTSGGRLEPHTRSTGDRVNHRVFLKNLADLDAEVDRWLRDAYAIGDRAQKKASGGDVPADLAAALKGNRAASGTWKTLTPRMRADFTAWVTDAKKAETRARRIEKAVSRLAEGHKAVY